MIRVAIVSPTFGVYGGLEAFVLALGAGLRGEPGLEVGLWFRRVGGRGGDGSIERAAAEAGLRPAFLGAGDPRLIQVLAQADVVHVQNPSPVVLGLAALLGRPVVLSMINHRPPWQGRQALAWAWARTWAGVRLHISAFVLSSWGRTGGRRADRVVPPVSRLGGEPAPPEQRRGFVFAARWVEHKGLEELIEAYHRAGLDREDCPLLLLGDGPLRPRIEERIAALGLRHVRAPGFVPEAERRRAFAQARWLVAPARTREDYGLTALEARVLGVPCIVSRDGGLPEAAGSEALLCDPGDIEGLASRMRDAAALGGADYAALSRRTAAEAWARSVVPPSWYACLYREVAQA